MKGFDVQQSNAVDPSQLLSASTEDMIFSQLKLRKY